VHSDIQSSKGVDIEVFGEDGSTDRVKAVQCNAWGPLAPFLLVLFLTGPARDGLYDLSVKYRPASVGASGPFFIGSFLT
jgi:hypothetical protein